MPMTLQGEIPLELSPSLLFCHSDSSRDYKAVHISLAEVEYSPKVMPTC